jgi:hypothetical protein
VNFLRGDSRRSRDDSTHSAGAENEVQNALLFVGCRKVK